MFVGTNMSVTCIIRLSTALDSDITMDVSWFKGNSLLSNGTDRVSISLISGKMVTFTSTLFINPLIDQDNATKFKCQAFASSDSVFVGKSEIGESSASIQVKLRSQLYRLISPEVLSYCTFYSFISTQDHG